MQAMDFWVQTTLERYIIEFSLEGHQSFSKVKVMFKLGFWGRILREILLWVKFPIVEESLLVFQSYLIGNYENIEEMDLDDFWRSIYLRAKRRA